MRMPLIALIPAVLLAGAAYAQSDMQTDDPLPAEPVEEQAEEEEEAPLPEVETTEAAGTWTRTGGAGRDTVAYVSDEGETLFSATCMSADTDVGDQIVEIKAVSAEDTVGAIDIFTSAGNARLPAAPDMSPDIATGMTEPVSRPTYVLASGAGEMRVVSGSRGIVFETDPMLKEVLRACHPDPATVPASEPDADEDGEGETDAEIQPVEDIETGD